MWSEWMARTLKPRPAAAAAEVVPAAPLPSPTRVDGRSPVVGETPSFLVREGRGEGEGAPALVDAQCS
jgi:hypothetical protein